MRRRTALGVVVVLFMSSGRAAAEGASPPPAAAQSTPDEPSACGGPGHPGIVLRAEGLDSALRAGIVEQLRAALAGRSFDLCEPANGTGAVAELDVTSLARPEGAPDATSRAAGVAVTLSVRDEVTDKRVSRDIDLRRIPEDGRALVIAQAADELLRASWAELLVADAPKPRREVPPEIIRAVSPPDALPPPPPAPARAPIVELGLAAALEHFGSGHTQLGPEIAVGVFPFARLGAVARAGFRSAARAEAPSGSVDPSSVVVALAAVVGALPRSGRVGLDAGVELFVTRVHYEATAQAGSRARSESGTAVDVSAIARGWLVLAPPLRATLGLALGAPLHSVRAVAADATIASISGFLLGGQLGLAAAW